MYLFGTYRFTKDLYTLVHIFRSMVHVIAGFVKNMLSFQEECYLEVVVCQSYFSSF
jgi:hypothetical protein